MILLQVIHKFFLQQEVLLKHSLEGLPYELFRYCEINQFGLKVVIPVQPFLSLKFLETQNWGNTKRRPFESFPHSETKKNLAQNHDTPSFPHLLSNKFFDARIFLKHRKIPYEIFWPCETKNFQWEILILLFFLSIFFSLPEKIRSTAQKVSSTQCFGTVRQNIFDGKS